MRINLNSRILVILAVLLFISFMDVAIAGKSNKRDVDATAVASAQVMTASRTHDVLADRWDEIACQIVWATASHTDATMTISATVDSTNYETISGTAYTLASAAGNHVWQVSVKSLAGLRFSYAKGSNTTGTYTLTCRKEVPTGSEN